jgi:simple sugar transport system ATP-binding protein
VEIIKMLYRNAQLLILDEPTAVLTPQEADELADILQQMVKSGRSVLYISHKLQEVLKVADRITVLRKGKKVATVQADEVDEGELTRLMIGKEILPRVEADSKTAPGRPILDIREISVQGNRGYEAVRKVSLELREGEILGIAGVAGNGQRELAEAIVGLREVKAGGVFLDGKEITNLSPQKMIKKGISLIPENCKEMGLVPALDLYENAILKRYKNRPISKGFFLDQQKVVEYGDQLVEEYQIQLSSAAEPIWKLSGGNLQRLLLGREISNHPRVLIASNPTRGLDIQAATEIRRLLVEQRDQGALILLISEDLDEVLSISDRVGVMYAGSLIGIRSTADADIEEIGLMMMGSSSKANMS